MVSILLGIIEVFTLWSFFTEDHLHGLAGIRDSLVVSHLLFETVQIEGISDIVLFNLG